MMMSVRNHLHARSAALLLALEARLPRIMHVWTALALLASLLRVAMTPWHGAGPELGTFIPYALVIGAPVASMALALRWFSGAEGMAQPARRLARVGRWRDVPLAVARRNPLYGTTGLMVPLMVGMLVNVPLRTAEYLAAMPALSGDVPAWLSALQTMMTADLVIMSSLYAVAFVAALRRLPLFPRLLAAIWVADLSLQAAIGSAAAMLPGLPATVSLALGNLLWTNAAKAMISILLWLPYLLLSRRVNVTFRHRIPV